MTEQPQAQFNGWAKVEVMGHQTHIGYVRTEVYGMVCLFRIDTPELPEREYTLERPEWTDLAGGRQWTPAGAKVCRVARPGHTVLVGAGSIYRIIPCSEAAAMRAIESEQRSELRVIEIPENFRIAAGIENLDSDCDGDEQDDDDDKIPY